MFSGGSGCSGCCSVLFVTLFLILYLVYDDEYDTSCLTTHFDHWWPVNLSFQYIVLILQVATSFADGFCASEIRKKDGSIQRFSKLGFLLSILWTVVNLFNFVWLIVGTVWFVQDAECVS
jgi:hypothetical protein